MLFNSYEFIFVFLPLVVVVFFALGRASSAWALRWIIVASLFFYGWWRPLNVLIIAPSIIINFVLAHVLQRLGKQGNRRAAQAVLLVGIAFNVAFLGYFKYTNFLLGTINDAFGTQMVLARIILPLGISFITFQKIAFLIDVHAGRIESFTLQDYCLFVLFFPQLIAGPIVHYREMMPQFHGLSCRFDKDNVSVGLTLFAFGLFKKLLLADKIAPAVTPIYERAASGSSVALLSAWLAAVGFTLQIYFDFSGYTDMALGIARMFGIRLPPNFNSPLRATNIIDFWRRWHMTLTRFLTAYIYNPLALWFTRRRAARNQIGSVAWNKSAGAFIEVLMFPTLLVMFISGMWHGAGYTFIVWGVLHGVFLTVNHAWRIVGPKLWRDKSRYERFMQPAGFMITFVSVAASMVIFRSATLKTAADLFKGMLGLHGIGVSELRSVSIIGLKSTTFWIAATVFIAFACPNTLNMLSRYEPALGWKPRPHDGATAETRVLWAPSLFWAVAVSMIAAFAILYLGGRSEFLYWQF
ncbi:MAG TPA: MBOAT family O-acyltransferase [Terriglobales bacterium]|jgi:alginate O-acetyltransferase complex protein AlgI|nr:MBOAT family O-acyltransferase [Terriglobales bacterium]